MTGPIDELHPTGNWQGRGEEKGENINNNYTIGNSENEKVEGENAWQGPRPGLDDATQATNE